MPPCLAPASPPRSIPPESARQGKETINTHQIAAWPALGFDEAEFLGAVGLKTLAGEKDRSVLELLEDINARGTTILMVTHDPELAERAQRNVHIVDGQVSDLVHEPVLRPSEVVVEATDRAS